MKNICIGPCAYDAGCKKAGLDSSGFVARETKFLDKLRPVPNHPNATTRIGYHLLEAQNRAFRDFHNSRVMKKMQPRIEYWKYSAQRYASRNSIR